MKIQELNVGDMVVSIAGHDRAKAFVVLARINENFVLIANGTTRLMSNPKLKKIKHLKRLIACDCLTSKITNDNISNEDIESEIKLLEIDRRYLCLKKM